MQEAWKKNWIDRINGKDKSIGINACMAVVVKYYLKELNHTMVVAETHDLNEYMDGALSPEYLNGWVNDKVESAKYSFWLKYDEFSKFINKDDIKVYFKAQTYPAQREFEKSKQPGSYVDLQIKLRQDMYEKLKEEIEESEQEK